MKKIPLFLVAGLLPVGGCGGSSPAECIPTQSVGTRKNEKKVGIAYPRDFVFLTSKIGSFAYESLLSIHAEFCVNDRFHFHFCNS
ncbi:MAG: hypothetical protein ACHBN1_30840 [Heteroscytonema crispum UTEX LB 1556]